VAVMEELLMRLGRVKEKVGDAVIFLNFFKRFDERI
jgi:hypothetical protein